MIGESQPGIGSRNRGLASHNRVHDLPPIGFGVNRLSNACEFRTGNLFSTTWVSGKFGSQVSESHGHAYKTQLMLRCSLLSNQHLDVGSTNRRAAFPIPGFPRQQPATTARVSAGFPVPVAKLPLRFECLFGRQFLPRSTPNRSSSSSPIASVRLSDSSRFTANVRFSSPSRKR